MMNGCGKKLSDSMRKAIIRLRRAGGETSSYRKIHALTGVSTRTIGRVLEQAGMRG